MKAEQIDVTSYAGRKGYERPLAFTREGFQIDVEVILEHWIEEEFTDRVRKRFFTVEGSDGQTHRIYFNEETRLWFYTSPARRT